MSRIEILPRHLADLIAAGEVVERPASAVKELTENSFDAGSGAVTIEIRDGGLTFIKITDDGCGIPKDEVPLAFARHATSKLVNEDGLENISTLGFRGEALAAIASVSRIDIITKTDYESEGTHLILDCGEQVLSEPAGCPRGTSITVSELFRNTPARQKYMKTDRAESAAVLETVKRLALSRPDISVKYIRDGETELHTPGDNRLDSCVYAVLGRDFIKSSAYAEYGDESVRAFGYVSLAEWLRGNRNAQFFFINGRCVKSRVMQSALEAGYRNKMLPGRFPSCVIMVETSFARVDVNVHPAKTEVRFLFEKQIFDGIFRMTQNALESEYEYEPAQTRPEQQIAAPAAPGTVSALNNTAGPDVTSRSYRLPPESQSAEYLRTPRAEYEPAQFAMAQFETEQFEITAPQDDFRIIGEIFTRYIIAETYGNADKPESLLIVDKHAAHERILFNELAAGSFVPMPQLLIEPIVISASESEVLIDNADALSKIGFHIEPLGFGSAAVRAIPEGVPLSKAGALLEEIAEDLSAGASDASSAADARLAGLACKAAIKSGTLSREAELTALVRRVITGEIQFCPHGRPVSYTMTKTQLDRTFKRLM